MKRKEIKLPIYDIYLTFISGNKDDVVDYINLVYNTNFDKDNVWASCFYINEKHIIWFDENTITLPVLIHEIAHMTFDIMDHVGLDIKDQEAFCYLQEYILTNILKCIPFIQMDHINRQLKQEDMQ